MRLRRPNIAKLREQRDEAGLVAALEDKDPAIREAAANALKRVAGPDAVQPLRSALQDQSRSVRLAVVATLENMEATDPLVDALGDKDSRVRASAAKSLANVGDTAAIEPLIGQFDDEDPKARTAAIVALESFDDPRVVEALGGALGDRNEAVRRAALSALEKLDAVDDRVLISVLENTKASSDERTRAAKRLAERGGPDAIDALIRALGDSSVASGAREGLEKMDDPGGAEALRELAESERKRDEAEAERRAREAAAEVRADVAILEGDEDKSARIGAAERLAARSGMADAVEPLIRALEDEDAAVRRLALKSLRESDDPRAVEAAHKPAVGDRYRHEWVHTHPDRDDVDLVDHWEGTLVEVSPPTRRACEVRVEVEEATGSFAKFRGTVQTVDLGKFPNCRNDHPSSGSLAGYRRYHHFSEEDGSYLYASYSSGAYSEGLG